MKILITGANGMLGKDLVPILKRAGHEVDPTDIEELDITNVKQIKTHIKNTKPQIIVNCAAYSQVDQAEEEQEKALLVNGIGAQNIALVCRKFNIDLCHLSTDYVFDGKKKTGYTPFDSPNPIQVYGQTKLAGEKYIQMILKRYYIVRTSWLYGIYGPNFVKTIHNLSQTQKEVRVVDDQIGSPTWTVTLSHIIEKILSSRKYGIYHVSDLTDNGISRFEFAKEILSRSGSSSDVVPVKTSEYPLPAKRPAYSVLDLSLTNLTLQETPPPWKKSLSRYLKEMKAQLT